MHDIIGDIHGHADELVELLHKLGYSEESGVFRHPERRVLFCGDFIDRGPRIRDTINIVRTMCESGSAAAVMGNHELNALAFHTPHPTKPDEFLRRHSEHNLKQHSATLKQLDAADLEAALNWFRTLPVSLDLGSLRVVHACWDDRDLKTLTDASSQFGHMSAEFLFHATQPGNPVLRAVERSMKGPEMKLPEGSYLIDREGARRERTRIRWYDPPEKHTLASYSWPAMDDAALAALPVPPSVRPAVYSPSNPPVFIGHYWLFAESPAPLAVNVACLDYSVAKYGMLTAYRHQGEKILRPDRFVTVPSRANGALN